MHVRRPRQVTFHGQPNVWAKGRICLPTRKTARGPFGPRAVAPLPYENLLKNNALVLPLMHPRPLRLHTRGEIREGGFTDAIRHLLRQQQM